MVISVTGSWIFEMLSKKKGKKESKNNKVNMVFNVHRNHKAY